MSFMKLDAGNAYYSAGRKCNYMYPILKNYDVLKIKKTLINN